METGLKGHRKGRRLQSHWKTLKDTDKSKERDGRRLVFERKCCQRNRTGGDWVGGLFLLFCFSSRSVYVQRTWRWRSSFVDYTALTWLPILWVRCSVTENMHKSNLPENVCWENPFRHFLYRLYSWLCLPSLTEIKDFQLFASLGNLDLHQLMINLLSRRFSTAAHYCEVTVWSHHSVMMKAISETQFPLMQTCCHTTVEHLNSIIFSY